MFVFKEEEYHTNLPIKYVFQEGENQKNYLVIVFSSFNDPTAERQHSYNYMRTLEKLDCHKLFILDSYGPRGCYYLGSNMSFEVESSVVSLVTYIIRKTGVSLNNVISVGSSKGGSAALYFGVKYNWGYVVAGAPQTKIADYIMQTTKETAAYILGDNIDNNKIVELNSLIYRQFEKNLMTKINILTSENDWQFIDHVKPLINLLENKGAGGVSVNCDNKIKSHGDIAKQFPEYLPQKILEIMYGININCEVVADNESIYITHLINDFTIEHIQNDIQFNYLIKLNDAEIFSCKSEKRIVFTPKLAGLYKVVLTVNDNNFQKLYEKNLGEFILGKNIFKLNDVILSSNKPGNLELKLDIDELQSLQYAFYIFKENQIVEKIWYQKNKNFVRNDLLAGNYKVMYFILMQDGNKIIRTTPNIVITNEK